MKYLPVFVLSQVNSADCSAGGVTYTNPDKLVVPCEDGFLSEADVAARGYVVLELMEPAFADCPPRFQPKGIEGWNMFGGNYVHTSDSRFRRAYGWHPIAVHDRVER